MLSVQNISISSIASVLLKAGMSFSLWITSQDINMALISLVENELSLTYEWNGYLLI